MWRPLGPIAIALLATGSCIAPTCGPGPLPTCDADSDCKATHWCQSNRTCKPPSCDDHYKNSDETDVDCGGSTNGCERCALGRGCLTGSDCDTGVCVSGRCAGVCAKLDCSVPRDASTADRSIPDLDVRDLSVPDQSVPDGAPSD